MNCKHIFAVLFSRKLAAQAEWDAEQQAPPRTPPEAAPSGCPACGSPKVLRDGKRRTGRGPVQRFECGGCRRKFTLDRAFSRMKHDPEAVTLLVRKALSGVARVHGRFGLQLAVKLVHGEADPRLERAGLTRVPTFGNLRDHGDGWLLKLLRRCVTAGWASFSGGDRPVVVLTEEGRAVMQGRRPARLLLPPAGAGTAAPGRRARPARAAVPAGADGEAIQLFEALRRHRLQVAHEERIAPFIVASDRTLRDIALLRPRTIEELQLAHGMGPHKAARYGAGILRVVASAPQAGAPRAGDTEPPGA